MNMKEILERLETQERMLRFKKFDNHVALELGKLAVEMAEKKNLPIAISIRKPNGFVMFQYACGGTEVFNESWLNRKHNSVVLTGKSTLRLHAEIKSEGEKVDKLQPWFLEAEKYAMYGGGFPIVVEGMGMLATMCVSGLDHESDHDAIIEVMSRYLNKPDVPRIVTGDIPK